MGILEFKERICEPLDEQIAILFCITCSMEGADQTVDTALLSVIKNLRKTNELLNDMLDHPEKRVSLGEVSA